MTPICGNQHTSSGGVWLCARPVDHEGPHHGVGGTSQVLITWTMPEGE